MIHMLVLLKRDKAALLASIFLATLIVACALGAIFLGPQASAMSFGAARLPPFDFSRGVREFLGTDQLGRSVLYMTLVAGATSLGIAVCAAAIAASLGTLIGVAAGYLGGLSDTLAMRLADVILSFPSLLLAILFVYLFEPSPGNIVILLVISRLPLYLRISRAETLEIRQRLFVDASRLLGASGWRICRRDIFPMVLPNVLTLAALDIGLLMLIESALSFLG
ncbi:MAG: ABC transporter permease, partial [Alphaproteobacteria bacterium]